MNTHAKTPTLAGPPQTCKRETGDENDRDFNGASVIDNRGAEIAITEDMVQRALHDLDIAWQQANSRLQSQPD